MTLASDLTPAIAVLAERVRCYWVQGMECGLLEIQKLTWFVAHKCGPYMDHLRYWREGAA